MIKKHRKLVSVVLSICIVLAPEMVLAQQPSDKETMRKQAIRLIPNDATAGLIAHPRAVLTAPGMEAVPIEVISAFGKQELGFDPMEIEVAVIPPLTAAAHSADDRHLGNHPRPLLV